MTFSFNGTVRDGQRSSLPRRTLLCGAAIASVLSAAGAADAQSTAPAGGADTSAAQVTEVVVTASRIAREGYTAPTPTTAVGRDQIDAQAPVSVADFVNELPALVGSITPRVATTGASATVGADLFNLRGLGANRTLVLLDGHRIAPTTLTGNIDVSLLPDGLVQRVDVVTGGASAAWGSDAVAGVVNYVLDRKFTGFKGEVQGGGSQQGDARFGKIQLTFGAPFDADRGHFLVTGGYVDQGRGDAVTSRDWFKSYKVINNPAFTATNGQPAQLLVPGVGLGVATPGGLITAGPLRGTQFDANGVPGPFNFGTTSGVLSVGGSAQDISDSIFLQVPSKTGTVFSRLSYDLAPNITAYAEVGYGHAKTDIYAREYERDGNITIQQDNAYLPAATKAQMVAAKVTNFAFGKYYPDWGPGIGVNDREQQRYVIGLQGSFEKGWTWDAYAQHGVTHFKTGAYSNDPITANYNLAVDAVVNPANGQIVCRSTLTNPTNGCVPLNVFGVGKASAAALAYIDGTSVQYTAIKQDVAAANINGEPFSLWAGPVSVAAGIEYRKESYAATSDALSPNNAYFLGNYHPSSGSYNVTEGFFETVVPLLKDKMLAKSLDFNGAVRETHYSESGDVTSWKAGLTWDVTDDIRFRATRSRDIRAPNLSELFQAGNAMNQTVNDPVKGATYSVLQAAGGNLNLQPEKADTTAFGVVLRPGWLPGFEASIDYFNIKINDAIFTQVAQTIISQCAAGITSQCAFVTRNAAGTITNVLLAPQNVSSEATDGVDIEATYRKPVSDLVASWKGDLTLRALGSYVDKRNVTANGVTTRYAGTNANFDQNSQAVPTWRWLASATYDLGPFSTTLSGRYISAGVFNKAWGPLNINTNDIPSVTYVDLSASYRFQVDKVKMQAYVAIQNLFDKAPPVAPIYGATGFLSTGTNGYLYDLIGRQYRAGLRFAF